MSPVSRRRPRHVVHQPGRAHVSAPRRVCMTCFLLHILRLEVAGLSASKNRGRAVMESGVSLAMESSGCENMPLSALHSVLLLPSNTFLKALSSAAVANVCTFTSVSLDSRLQTIAGGTDDS